MFRLAHALLALLPWAAARVAQDPAAAPTILTVRQAQPADLVGADDVVLKAACDRLRKAGGTLVIGPGRYVLRRSLVLPANILVRGEPGAILALPSPVLTATDAPAGARELVLAGAHEFAGDVLVQVLPPVGSEHFADEKKTPFLDLQAVERVQGQRLFLRQALAVDVPAGSRVGYPHKLLQTHKDGLATLEGLSFEGGRIEAIPMPGHHQRCAIWASSPFGYELERPGPPGRGVNVRHCRFSDFYGRAIALYYQADGVVEGCLFERIHDEAIDLDHFVEGYRVAGNEVRASRWGVVLNDASRNVVEYNRIEDVEIGIWSWRYEKVISPGVNEENVIRHNFVRASDKAIFLDRTCVRYRVEHNWVDGPIEVAEPENHVHGNTSFGPGR